MKDAYDIGDEIILQSRFYNRTGTPTNPTTVVCHVRTPDGVSAAITATVTAETGVYEAPYSPAQEGKHWYRFAGTGAVKTAGERWFTVVERQVPAP